MSVRCVKCGGEIRYSGLRERYYCKSCGLEYAPAFDNRAFFDCVKADVAGGDSKCDFSEYEKKFNHLLNKDLMKRIKEYDSVYKLYICWVDDFFGKEEEIDGNIGYSGYLNCVQKVKLEFLKARRAFNDSTLSQEEFSKSIEKLATVIRCLYHIAEYSGEGQQDLKCIGKAKGILRNRRGAAGEKKGLARYCSGISEHYKKLDDEENSKLFLKIKNTYDVDGVFNPYPEHLPRNNKYALCKVYEARLKQAEEKEKNFYNDGEIAFNLYKEYDNEYGKDFSAEEVVDLFDVFWDPVKDLYKSVQDYYLKLVKDNSCDYNISQQIDYTGRIILFFFAEFADGYQKLLNSGIISREVKERWISSRYYFVHTYYWLVTQINPCPDTRNADTADQFKRYAQEYVKWNKNHRHNPFENSSSTDHSGSSNLDEIKVAYKWVTGEELE